MAAAKTDVEAPKTRMPISGRGRRGYRDPGRGRRGRRGPGGRLRAGRGRRHVGRGRRSTTKRTRPDDSVGEKPGAGRVFPCESPAGTTGLSYGSRGHFRGRSQPALDPSRARCRQAVACSFPLWGRSSVGRALQWHCRGQGFDSPRLHQTLPSFPIEIPYASGSCRQGGACRRVGPSPGRSAGGLQRRGDLAAQPLQGAAHRDGDGFVVARDRNRL